MAEVASAYISLMPSTAGFGSKLNSQVGPEVDGTAKKTGLSFGKVFAAAAAIGLGAKAFDFLKGSLEEAREAQVVGARTESVIKSMGLAGKVSADQIGSLAMSLSNKTAIDDEAIQSGQNLLLTFGNVAKSAGESNGVFAQTSQLMVDMSKAMGTDVKSSALQLGKALNDPVKGVSALTRVGVSFTEQQKKQIAAFTESGNLAKAQGVILGEVKKQFGGAAASMATPAERASVAFGNLKEQIGTALLPIVDKFLNLLASKVVPAISSFIAGIQSGTGAGGQFASIMTTLGSAFMTAFGFIAENKTLFTVLAASLGTVVAAVKAWTIAQTLLNVVLTANPIGLIVLAIAGLVAGLVVAYQKSETFRNIVNTAFEAVKTVIGVVVEAVKIYLNAYKAVITTVFNAVRTVVSTVIGWFGKFVPRIFDAVVTAVRTYVNVYKTIVTTAFEVVKTVVSTTMNGAKAVVGTAIDAIRGYFNLISAIVGKVRGWFEDIVSAVRTKLGDAVDLVKGFPGKVTDALGDIGSALYNKGRDLIQGLIDGIQSMAGKIGDAISSVLPDIPGVDVGGALGAILGRAVVPSAATPSSLDIPITPSTLSGGYTSSWSIRPKSTNADDLGAKLDKMSRQLEALTKVSAVQGREFGRALNNVAAHAARR